MTEALDAAQWQAWRDRRTPPVERLDTGIWSIPVPIPNNPLRYTLSYLISGTDGFAVIDPGWDTPEGWTALTDGLATAGAAITDVLGVVVTHVHADHHGLSGRVRQESGAWIAMHPAERDTLPARLGRAPDHMRTSLPLWLRSHGTPDGDVAAVIAMFPAADDPTRHVELAEPDVLLEDGDAVPLRGRGLSAVWTPGHTPGHLCVADKDAGVLLTGDHLLPHISPHIGVQPTGDPPLAPYLDSLERITVFDKMSAYPAHEYRFRGIAERVATLRAHHDARCRELLDVVGRLGQASA
jgi:glyoxylase-like metal-dependent hydrolase (beta-lactamase superfamily II)